MALGQIAGHGHLAQGGDLQAQVLELLDTLCQNRLGKSVSGYQSHSQILMDCY